MQLITMSRRPAEASAVPTSVRVALVCMPFAHADRPSIQLGLISAIAEAAGFPTELFHFNLDLARELGAKPYYQLCQLGGRMTGEWLFAPSAFGDAAPGDEESYLRCFPGESEWAAELGKDATFFRELRHQILPGFVERCFASVSWGDYQVVGFSSLFQQNVASLALARRIKERHPGVRIIFGGANMDGDMGAEYARSFAFIDYVVSGEADEAFPKLLRMQFTRRRRLRLIYDHTYSTG